MQKEEISLINSGFAKKSRRKSLTQFIPKNNIIYNPYNNSNGISNENSRSESPNELPKISTSSSAISPPKNNRYNIRKPDFYVKRQNGYKNMNGYYTSPEYETEIDTETETDTE
eukprot:890609_1